MPKIRIKSAKIAIKSEKWKQEKIDKWTKFANHNRRRFFKNPTNLNFLILIKTENTLEDLENI